MIGATPVEATSGVVSHREDLATTGADAAGESWYVLGHPRQFVWALQTDGVLASTLRVDWAIRTTAQAVPEWLYLQTITLVPGGATPVLTMLGATPGGTGAVWLRFTLVRNVATPSTAVSIAATAFI